MPRLHSTTRRTLMALAASALLASAAQAALVSRSGGMIYDTELDLTILADRAYARTSGYDADGVMTWGQSLAFADQLEYGGYSDWRLPSKDELGHIFFDELGYVRGQRFYDTVISAEQSANLSLFVDNLTWSGFNMYWSGTAHERFANQAWYLYAHPAGRSDLMFGFTAGGRPLNMQAMVVRSGDVAATANNVPEPNSLALVCLALAGTAAARRRVARDGAAPSWASAGRRLA